MPRRRSGPNVLDGAITLIGLAAIGVPTLLGDRIDHLLAECISYGALVALVVFVGWRVGGWLLGRAQSEAETPVVDIRQGAFAGRDNNGSQTVFNGPVTQYIGASPAHPKPEQPTRVSTVHAIYPALPLDLPPVVPDWTIKEMFEYLQPGGFEDDAERNALGREVIDKFAIGAVKVWGRRIEDGKRLALSMIDPEDWKRAKFTYWFLGDDPGGNVLDVRCEQQPGRGLAPHEYSDLRVRRDQVESVWPNDPVLLQNAARLAYEAEEASGEDYLITAPTSSPEVKLTYFKHHFLTAEAPMFGIKSPSSVSRLISKEEYAKLVPVDGKSELKYEFVSMGPGYHDVTIRRRDMERAIRAHIESVRRLVNEPL